VYKIMQPSRLEGEWADKGACRAEDISMFRGKSSGRGRAGSIDRRRRKTNRKQAGPFPKELHGAPGEYVAGKTVSVLAGAGGIANAVAGGLRRGDGRKQVSAQAQQAANGPAVTLF
jgi:hypothetical protein